jgi:hypothetical protein
MKFFLDSISRVIIGLWIGIMGSLFLFFVAVVSAVDPWFIGYVVLSVLCACAMKRLDNRNPESSMNDLQMWLDAADTNTIVKKSGDVYAIIDKSGGNVFRAKTANIPLKGSINGLGALDFQGINGGTQNDKQ